MLPRRRARIALALSVIGGTLFGAVPTVSAADATVAVTASSTAWVVRVETGSTGTVDFVAGPAVPPAGDGSLRMTTSAAADGIALASAAGAGTRLDAFTTLGYSTYVAPGALTDAPVIALQFDIDADSTDANTAFQGRLVFEPYYTETVVKGTWQRWDTLTQGRWWATRSPMNVECSIAAPCSWSEVLTAFPHAAVRTGTLLKAGSGWAGFDGNVDRLQMGTASGTTTYDFGPGFGPCLAATDHATMTIRLLADCQTSHTILVPDGWTLDGDEYTSPRWTRPAAISWGPSSETPATWRT